MAMDLVPLYDVAVMTRTLKDAAILFAIVLVAAGFTFGLLELADFEGERANHTAAFGAE
jgi:hypothetical protein